MREVVDVVKEKMDVTQYNYYLGRMKEIDIEDGVDALYSPKTSVVLLIDKNSGLWARGVAICSDKDNFCKKTGRAIAKSRAMRALGKQQTCPNNIMRDKRDAFLLPEMINNKCSFKPELSDHERKMFQPAA